MVRDEHDHVQDVKVRELKVGDRIRVTQPWDHATYEGDIVEFDHTWVWAGGCRLFGIALRAGGAVSRISLLGETPVKKIIKR